MPSYNGHRSWNAWNISLWINNDEGLYNLALDCLNQAKRRGWNRRTAARLFTTLVGTDKTPDGGRYNVTCVYEAMEGMQS